MRNFTFYNPVRILFGKGQIANIGAEIPADAKILVIYGGGSVKRNGVHEQVTAALAGRPFAEFWGVEPNPRFETLMQAVEKIRAEGRTFLLAVGGGSVADGAKFIAAAAPFAGDPWTILSKKAPIAAALPLGVVLTLPATGSEMNTFSVVTKWESREKLAFGSPLVYPKFSVLDPETTFTLPARYIGNGVVDAFTHTVEQYLTYPADAPLQDRQAEAILTTLIEEGPKTLAHPTDYAARANFMWAATNALNGLIGVGVPQDWATHMIGHELTALHGLDHAQTLAVTLPGVLQFRREAKREKLLQYGARVWGVTGGDQDARITMAIERTRTFFESMGVPTRLSDYGVTRDAIPPLVDRMASRGPVALGERADIGPTEVAKILELCL
jgi:NADP-dependent alcohol dehydrogenase